MKQFIKEILRILIAGASGFWLQNKINMSFAVGVLMFLTLYLIVAFIIEGIEKLFKRRG